MNKLQSWILSLKPDNYKIKKASDSHIICETQYAKADINFYPQDMVEFSITSHKSDDPIFYLHFQVQDEERSHQLYNEMIDSLLKLKEANKIRVLLTCTSGLTTSFFAEKLNEGSQLLSADFTFKAVDFSHLYEHALSYDIILLAPQVSFNLKKVKDVLPQKLVLALPVGIFGSYDVGGCLTFLLEQYSRFSTANSVEQSYTLNALETAKTILVVGVLWEQQKMYIRYRVYVNGSPVYRNQTVKDSLHLEDFHDIIDTTLFYGNVDLISLSIPGLVSDNHIELRHVYTLSSNLREVLYTKYNIPVIISNNANAIALGIYATHNSYRNLSYFSMAHGTVNSGLGSIVNGTLATGKNGLAGENRFMTPVLNLPDDAAQMVYSPEGVAKLIALELLPALCTIAPEAVYIRNQLNPDVNIIRAELLKYLPERYVPDLIPVSSIYEYLMYGQLVICARMDYES